MGIRVHDLSYDRQGHLVMVGIDSDGEASSETYDIHGVAEFGNDADTSVVVIRNGDGLWYELTQKLIDDPFKTNEHTNEDKD